MRKHVSFLQWLSIVIVVAISAVFILLLRGTPQLARAIREVRAADRHVDAAVEIWRTTGHRGAGRIVAELTVARTSLTRSAETIEALSFLALVPGVRGVLTFGERAAEGAALVVDGAAALASIADANQRLLDRYADRAPADLTDAERAELFAAVGSSLASAREALDAFERGDAILGTLDCPRFLTSVVEICRTRSLLRHRQELARVRDVVRTATDAAEHAMVLLGGRAPTSVLLLFLNNTELRPGGGFLGTYGLATVHRGTITAFTTDDVYNLDRFVEGTQRIPPPEPFRRHEIVSNWYLRDANWSPDFKESSRTVLDFYA
ncbi:MAG: DUF4012 domain-containing protein, partial [bacterium]|nr:DUF4012 domain-containing protein [bacterium]